MENTSAGAIEASARVTWAGWGGEISGNSGFLNARTATQIELGGPGGGTNPEELLAASLANCYTSTLTSLACTRNMNVASIETWAQTRLNWDETTPHHIAQADLRVRIVCARPQSEVLALAEEARKVCPVCNVLAATAEVSLAVTVDAGEAAVGSAATVNQPG